MFRINLDTEMKYPMSDNAPAILHAKEEFLARGELQQGAVAEAIERSWRRCLANGIDATSTYNNVVITAAELAHKQEKNHLLLSHARPEMATLNEQISHTRSMVILTDEEGIILHSLGDQDFLNEAQRVSLEPGSSWHEDHRGTNAIGTALVEQLPMTVRGAEHFMERHHFLSCSAVPIFGARNELLGTLDVSNDYLLPQQHTLALVKMAAQMIENRLFRASYASEFVLHFHARPEFIGTLWEGLAMFSGDGKLVATNRSGQFQLEIKADERYLHFSNLFNLPLEAVIDQTNDAGKLIFPLRLNNGARIYAQIEMNAVPLSYAQSNRTSSSLPVNRSSAANLEMLNSGDAQIGRAIDQVRRVLNQNIPILIEGETGSGKELFARAIHDASQRRSGPWVAVNCAALPEGLIEAELFGYEEGAFTGARRKGSPGKLEQANGGTLFLDEIGDMPLSLQARLLRVLQERSVTPLGGSKSKAVDFALVSATNQNLREKVESGQFRSDLYYRLNGLRLSLPPLRQRTDLAALIKMILQVENAVNAEITPEVMRLFEAHPWPGNIRQLHNVVRTAFALSEGEPISESHLTQDFIDEFIKAEFTKAELAKSELTQNGQAYSANAEATATCLNSLASEAVRAALKNHSGNISATARQLGISRNTLYRKLKLLGLA
jgi:transcriptional regulator of acetoin/glycerol metabolism